MLILIGFLLEPLKNFLLIIKSLNILPSTFHIQHYIGFWNMMKYKSINKKKKNKMIKTQYPVFHITEETFIEIMSDLKRQYLLDKSNARLLQKVFNTISLI